MSAASIPASVIDCHVHVFDPKRFPYDPQSDYLPRPHETATADQLISVLDSHGVSHALVVNPTSGYGADNRVTIDAITRYPERLRGIAVLDAGISERELVELKSAGIVGARVDFLGAASIADGPAISRIFGLLREQGMIAQIQAAADQLTAAVDLLRHERCTAVIDHMGRPDPREGPAHPAFRALLGLAGRANVNIKLSGPFRFSQTGFPYADADPFTAALVDAFGPERCVWGSDWPFVRMDHRLDYGPALSTLGRWVPDPRARHRILWDTPRRLFGFGSGR